MPVNTVHPQYEEMTKKGCWKRCRDAHSGTDAVKAAKTDYLPFLGDSTNTADQANYNNYLARALYYNATARTVEGIIGAVFRKPPEKNLPEAIEELTEDITLTGISLEEFAKSLMREILIAGRCGVLVEMPRLQEVEKGAVPRPWFVLWKAEALTNWKVEYRAGAEVLICAVIHEEVLEDNPEDEFKPLAVEQYRVLVLEEKRYRIDIWRKMKIEGVKDKWEITETYEPVMRGLSLNFIPFCFFGSTTTTPDIDKPVILDLVDVNLSHYRSSADLEHGRHFTGLPQPWASGFPKEEKYRIGSTTAWVTETEGGRVGYAQVTGGFDSLEKALEEKRDMMASLGARLIESMKKAAEAASTVRLRHSGEVGVVQQICVTINIGIEKLLRYAAVWRGITDQAVLDSISYKLNTDLFEEPMDPQQLTALMALWQSGGISWPTLYTNLQNQEIARLGVSAEEERAEIDAEGMVARQAVLDTYKKPEGTTP